MHPVCRRLIPALLIFPLAAHGTIVTTTADEDNGSLGGGTGVSLREAVKYSPAGDIITFTPILSGQTIRLTLGQITIARPITIDGSTLPTRITLSGDKTGNGRTNDDTRVIEIDDVAVTLHSLIISGGAGFSDAKVGGAVYAIGHSVNLTVDRCTFSGNRFVSDGAAIYFYGAYNDPGTKLTVRHSTFTGNTASGYGGAIFAHGTADIQNTTITGNKAFGGGGIAIFFNTTALIHHTTITGNTATSVGGCAHNSGSITLRNSIIAGNTAPTFPGIYGSYGNDNNIASGSLLLAPLGDYGGPTQTMPPLPGSPAIDKGTLKANVFFPPLTTDQRGLPRAGTPDVGAVEYQPADFLPLMPYFWALDTDGDGLPYAIERLHGTDPAVPDAASPRLLRAPVLDGQGRAILRFEVVTTAPDLASRPRWSLKRSADLSPGSFQEIYHYGFYGSYAFTYTGTSYTREPMGTIERITVIDTNPPPGGAFYRFEAVLAP